MPRKTALTFLWLGVFLFLLGASKIVAPPTHLALLEFGPKPATPPPTLPERKQSTAPEAIEVKPSVPQLADASHALDAFYAALQRTESGDSVTRILHYGDSPVTADSITADMRSLLQERFGNAGHGFVLIAKPWAWYGHRGVELRGSGWRSQAASQGDRARDGLHGLGGVSFEGHPGAWSVIKLDSEHDHAEVSYLTEPGGGRFSVQAGDATLGTVDTSGPAIQPGWTTFPLPAGTREIRIGVDAGIVRMFGVTFLKGTRGVIYNSLGLNGAQVQVIVRYFNATQWAEQIQRQRPDLVILNYGTNESIYPQYLDTYYPGELREVIRRVKAAVPQASVLIMSPMDHGQRGEGGQILTPPAVLRVVEMQRKIAAETGCAFFNTFEAMGGAGTMARWYTNRPQMVAADFMHPFPAGARKVGLLFDEALLAGYQNYKANHKTNPKPRLTAWNIEPRP